MSVTGLLASETWFKYCLYILQTSRETIILSLRVSGSFMSCLNSSLISNFTLNLDGIVAVCWKNIHSQGTVWLSGLSTSLGK